MNQDEMFANRIAAKMQSAAYLPDYGRWLAREVGNRKAQLQWHLAFNLVIAQTIREVEIMEQHSTKHEHDQHKQPIGFAVGIKS